MSKARLSASVDADLIDAAEKAVAEGRSDSLSAWVNDALRRKRDHDARLEALAAFVAGYEAASGVITADDVRQAVRRARARAVTVRSDPSGTNRVKRRKRSA